MICYFWMKLFSISNVHFDGHALTLNEIVIIHTQVILNCQMSNVQFTNFVLTTNS